MPRPQLRRAQEEVPGGQAWPPGHCWQAPLPGRAEKVPPAQGVQLVAPMGEEAPAGHGKQSVKVEAALALLNLPAGQARAVLVSVGQ